MRQEIIEMKKQRLEFARLWDELGYKKFIDQYFEKVCEYDKKFFSPELTMEEREFILGD